MAATPPDESTLIKKLFAPLTRGSPGALNLTDDAALVSLPPGMELVVSTDVLVESVHFRAADRPEDVGRKALRVNLSDLAAKGAEPTGYLLAVCWPDQTPWNVMESFAAGLAQEGEMWSLPLLGGDTVVGGVWTISVSMFGTVPTGGMILRSGGGVGDGIYVSGSVGDSSLGLKILEERLSLPKGCDEAAAFLSGRYILPEPRVSLGRSLRGVATACMDVSDGLLADLSRLCAASGVGAVIRQEWIPLSPAARTLAETGTLPESVMGAVMGSALSGGDDYELLFTAPASAEERIAALSGDLGLPLTRIGVVEGSPGIRLEDRGRPVEISGALLAGHDHFRPRG